MAKFFVASWPGIWLGASAIVRAANEDEAKQKIIKYWSEDRGREVKHEDIDIEPLKLHKLSDIYIMDDGDY